MLGIPGPGRVAAAAANFYDAAFRGGLACHHVGDLVSNAASLALETAPGGHLGVLTGRAAHGTTWKLLDGHIDR